MCRPFTIKVKVSGSINHFDNGNSIQTFTPRGNKNTTKESALNYVKKHVALCGCKIEEVISITENKA